ncbi:MAG TPA: hypothetical protein VFE53_19355 [Mucilaginibacter sp.]|nr:hypothetical protein [Mucilaginibacter sp.]
MKLKLKILSLVVLSSMLMYTACKKTSKAPAGPALTPTQVSSQVALNIYQSLFGGLAGVDLSGGIGSPGSLAFHNHQKVINDLSNPTCGLTVDTTLTLSLSAGDSTISIGGTVKFAFACTSNVVSSFTTNDNLTIAFTSPSLKLSYQVAENLSVVAINPSNPTTNIELNGSLNSDGSYQYLTGTKQSGSEVFDYTLASVIATGDGSADVLSGTATFNTSGSGPKGVWNYQGTMTFLGNHMASVVINGKTYTVNLLTGAVS